MISRDNIQKQIETLTQAQRREAFYKYKIIQPYLQQQTTLVVVCKKNNIPLRTAKSWVSFIISMGWQLYQEK